MKNDERNLCLSVRSDRQMQCIASLGSQFGFVKQGGLDMGGGKEEWEETKEKWEEEKRSGRRKRGVGGDKRRNR